MDAVVYAFAGLIPIRLHSNLGMRLLSSMKLIILLLYRSHKDTFISLDEVDTILSKVSTPTLALVPIVMILAVVLVILTGCVIAMRLKYKEVNNLSSIERWSSPILLCLES